MFQLVFDMFSCSVVHKTFLWCVSPVQPSEGYSGSTRENGDGRRGRRMGRTEGVFGWGRNSVMINFRSKDTWGKRRTILVEISHFTDEKCRAGIVKALQGENLKDCIRGSLCHLLFFPLFTPHRLEAFISNRAVMSCYEGIPYYG